MEKEKACRAAARKDVILLVCFALLLMLIVVYVAYEAVCAEPGYAVPVILAAIAVLGVLCSLPVQIGRYLGKHAAEIYEKEIQVPENGKECPHD